MPTPEQRARATIDRLLTDAGWLVQDRAAGVAVLQSFSVLS
jgi:hypothetical protein